MRRTVDKMCGKGWTVVVYNRRGHRDRSGIRSNVVDAVDAEVSELACEVTSPRYPEAEEAPDVGPAAVSGVPLAPDKRKRPWPMYSDLEDMHEVCQRGPVMSDRSIALGAYGQPGRPRPGVGCVLHVTCLDFESLPSRLSRHSAHSRWWLWATWRSRMWPTSGCSPCGEACLRMMGSRSSSTERPCCRAPPWSASVEVSM